MNQDNKTEGYRPLPDCESEGYLHSDTKESTILTKKQRAPVKLIVFDLDGTLLNPQQFVSKRNMQAMDALRAAGIGFTLASGRTEQHMRLFAEQINVELPIIACNGAVIYDHKRRQDVYRKQMSEQLSSEVLDHLLANQLDFLCYMADGVMHPEYSRKVEVMRLYNAKAAAEGSEQIQTAVLTADGVRSAARRGMVKILALYDTPTEKALLEELAARHSATVIASMSGAIDVMAPEVSKGTGMVQLARILGFGLENTVAFGDHDNDASMISLAGIGFAMGEATPAAKAVADIIAPNCADDGVAIAIEKYILPGIFG